MLNVTNDDAVVSDRSVRAGRVFGRRTLASVTLFALAAGLIGACQIAPVVSVKKLEEHRESTDLTGLKPAQILEELKVTWAIPGQWSLLPPKTNPLYTHQQWRSPTLATGVGVAHIHLPLALPASAIIWFAKNEYVKRTQSDDNSGKMIGQWTDELGRQWFEAENSKYHVRGYALTRGSEAWIVYTGYRMTKDRQPSEIALAEKSIESVVPIN